MELSKKQQEIVEATEEKILVMAAAASGKTRILTERVKYLLKSGVKPKDIVVITFTNAAADEMKERIGEQQGLFIGTIHSYCAFLLLSKGIIEARTAIEEEKFDELFNIIQEHSECIQPISYLLLDEAQDTDPLQYQFLLDMVDPYSFFIVGDSRQSIYSFRGAMPKILNKIAKRADIKVYNLNENYRNGRTILAYAKNKLKSLDSSYKDDSIAMCAEVGKVIEDEYTLDNIYKYLKNSTEYGDWFILTRTNEQINTICNFLNKKNIPTATFKRAGMGINELRSMMKSNTVKVLTVHTAKGLETDNVIAIGPTYWKDETNRVDYVAATRAKKQLIWLTMPRKKKYKKWE